MSAPMHFKTRMYFYRVLDYEKLIDGDSVTLQIDLGDRITRWIRCRLFGIDAHKKGTALGDAARQYLLDLCNNRTLSFAQTFKDTREFDQTGKYGRYLVVLYGADGENFNEMLVRAGLATPYNGQGKAQ